MTSSEQVPPKPPLEAYDHLTGILSIHGHILASDFLETMLWISCQSIKLNFSHQIQSIFTSSDECCQRLVL